MKRNIIFPSGEIFHICNKSIANYGIFKDLNNAQRFINVLDYYNSKLILKSFSHFLLKNKNFKCESLLYPKEQSYVKFIAYCIMPDHYHLLIKILNKNYLSKYIGDLENSFSKYFNIKFARKGPLWQSSFRAVHISTNKQLLHISRYIHINPTSSNLVERPEDWFFSSYKDYIVDENVLKTYVGEISIKDPKYYQKFTEDQIDYQRKLKSIKRLILE